MVDRLDIDDDDFLTVVRAIHAVPLRRDTKCVNCGDAYSYLTLHVYIRCPSCDHQTKTRSFSSAAQPQDIIGAVLAWIARATPADRDELLENYRKWFDDEWLVDQSED